MSTHKHIDTICIIITVIAVVFTVLFMFGRKLGIQAVVDEDSEAHEGTSDFTANDLNGDWDISDSTMITLNGDEVTISGSGAYENDGSVYISTSGTYVLSGSLTNGQIVIDTDQSSKVWILLNGVNIYCDDDAALRIEQADKVFLTLAAGTDNILKSGAAYSEEAASGNVSGALFSRDDLTINGSGSLDISSDYKHGIDVNDSLVITGGTITVTAPQDGIHVNDDMRICNADLTVTADDDAITVGKAFMIESGSVQSEGCYEGIEADTIEVRGGMITLYPTDDGLNAETSISVSGGELTVLNADGRDADGMDSNGDITITGGTVRISLPGSGSNNAIDYGSESGGICTISGGNVIASASYVMAEGFDTSSSQCSIFYVYNQGIEAGSEITLSDTSGNVLLTWEVPYSYTAVTLSCPELTVGNSYVISLGDHEETVTIEETSGAYGDALDSMFGGGFGGGKPGGGGNPDGTNPGEGGGPMGDGRGSKFEGDDSERPEPPEGMDFSENGERPEPPEGMNFGDGSEPPEPPDGGVTSQ